MFYLTIFLILALTIAIFALFIYGHKLCKLVIYPRKKTYEDGLNNQISKLNLNSFYDNLEKEDILIDSEYGYKLNGIFIPNGNSKKCIILCHGITANINYSVKYIKPFYNHGFSIFMYDHRNHGLSGGTYTSMGYFEKNDLKTCADYIVNRLGEDITLGVLGESMGAATVIQYCAIDDRVSFCVEDCGYSDVSKLFEHRLKEDYHIKFPLLIKIANLIMRIKYGWNFKAASPIEYIKDLSLPILFIHGENDDYVPTYMVHELYALKNKGIKDIYIATNAVHADALMSDEAKYIKVIDDFLKKINLS